MRTNIVIDDSLLKAAFECSAQKTKKGLVEEALRELIKNRGRKDVRELPGTVELHKGYDHKKLRREQTR